jgi:hypothetical protein
MTSEESGCRLLLDRSISGFWYVRLPCKSCHAVRHAYENRELANPSRKPEHLPIPSFSSLPNLPPINFSRNLPPVCLHSSSPLICLIQLSTMHLYQPSLQCTSIHSFTRVPPIMRIDIFSPLIFRVICCGSKQPILLPFINLFGMASVQEYSEKGK